MQQMQQVNKYSKQNFQLLSHYLHKSSKEVMQFVLCNSATAYAICNNCNKLIARKKFQLLYHLVRNATVMNYVINLLCK